MKATIYFKDSANKPSVMIDGLISIKARSLNQNSKDKNYSEKNFNVFTPFVEESYAFSGRDGVISVLGADILYVEFKED